MGEIDKRGKLLDQPFDYQSTKDGRLLIYWNNRHVMTLKGKEAAKLTVQLAAAHEAAVQLLLAKATGHFKHGNERDQHQN